MDFMTNDDLQRYFDVTNIEQAPEYDIVNPIVYTRKRRRRDIESEDEHKDIHLEAFGEEFHLSLIENTQLLSEGLEVEIHNSDGTIDRVPLKSQNCFYHGQLLSHNVSSIAVSTCKGLMGMIAMENYNLYIRPLNDNHAKELRRRRRDVENPHIIYRRGVDEDLPADEEEETNSTFCGLDPVFPDSHIFRDAMMEQMQASMTGTSVNMTSDAAGAAEADDNADSSRRKRATGFKYLEVRVMADYDMVKYHGIDDVVPYTLTLLNIVAARYAEPSLGPIVLTLHVVRLGILNADIVRENAATLTVTSDGRATLSSWSDFQASNNVASDNHPRHYDNAILISRKDLSLDGSSSLLGIAWLSGTCSINKQASLSQDAGLSTGQIIAHEVGHTLGMPHDGSGCDDKKNVMSSSRPTGPGAFQWSTCSQGYFNRFIAHPSIQCLDDFPISNSEYLINAQDRPGSTSAYTADEQCRQLLGSFSRSCTTDVEKICSRLFCYNPSNRGCYSSVPAAEGTPCAYQKWCISGDCVSINNPGNPEPVPPIDGGWSSWSSISECSRSCGGGVRSRERSCNNPAPSNGGALCQGPDAEHELCNRQDCSTNQLDFANEQCAATNGIPFGNKYYTWQAYFVGATGDTLCAYRCLSDRNNVTSRGDYFIDGTRCSDDAKNELLKCVGGSCVEFGCDGVLNSGQRYDPCRVCGGDGSECSRFTGTFNGGSQSAFTTFVDIPFGSTSVEITNTNSRYSFMAVKDADTNYYVFGQFDRAISNEYPYQRTIVKYHSGISETIYIDGPTTINLSVQVYLLSDPTASNNVRPRISIEYYSPEAIQPVTPENTNHWITSEGPCSVTCGNGIVKEVVLCVSPSNTVVDDSRCDQSTRPQPSPQPCNKGACQSGNRWRTSPGECTVTCGNGIFKEVVTCVSPSNQVLDDSLCDQSTRPTPFQQICYNDACPNTNQWSILTGPCSTSCGSGVSQEIIICKAPSGQSIDDSQCDAATRPTPGQKPCIISDCPTLWFPLNFGACSGTCGTGTQTRQVWCVRSNGDNLVIVSVQECDGIPKPVETQPCTNANAIPCPTPPPATGVWVILKSECSVTCGPGTQTSFVTCRPFQGSNQLLLDTQCPQPKPTSIIECNKGNCPVYGVWVITYFGDCSVTCGTGTQTASVSCRPFQGSNQILPDTQCPQPKPTSQTQCNKGDCPVSGVWVTTPIDECSLTCGAGIQTVSVTCRPFQESNQLLLDTQCPQPKPTSKIECNKGNCPLYGVWVTTPFGECTATCGAGTRTRTVTCRLSADSTQFLPESLCPGNKPATSEECSQQSCISGVWVVSDYSECSVTCGEGGMKYRTVSCRISEFSQQYVSEYLCKETKPPNNARCNQQDCEAAGIWDIGEYSECSVSCGVGTKFRTVNCRSRTSPQILLDSECQGNKPQTNENCNLEECPESPEYSWLVLNGFEECSVTCGRGTQLQRVWCVDKSSLFNFFQVDDSLCADQEKPTTAAQDCNLSLCPVSGKWVSTQYNECSVTCGTGKRERQVFCQSTANNNQLPDSQCDPSTKPSTILPCNNGECPVAPPPPSNNNEPDQGVACAGLYTYAANNIDRISFSTEGQFCKEGIVAPVGQTIKLAFTQCNIRCSEGIDVGYVRDGHRRFTFCCNDKPFSWTSATNIIQIEHLTQSAGHGYMMTVQFLGEPDDTGCDKVLTTTSGTVTSPGYPSPYPHNALCQSVIIAPPGKTVKLDFTVFNLHSNSPWAPYYCFDSAADNVEIYDLDSTDGLRYCGRYSNPAQIRIPPLENRVLIQFKSDNDGLALEGFQLQFTVE